MLLHNFHYANPVDLGIKKIVLLSGPLAIASAELNSPINKCYCGKFESYLHLKNVKINKQVVNIEDFMTFGNQPDPLQIRIEGQQGVLSGDSLWITDTNYYMDELFNNKDFAFIRFMDLAFEDLKFYSNDKQTK